jgi:hypothetical protein
MIEPQVVMLEPEMVALKLLVDSWKPNLIESMIDDYFVAAKVIMPKTGKEITAEVAAAIIAAGDDAFGEDEDIKKKIATLLLELCHNKVLWVTLSPPHPSPPPPTPSQSRPHQAVFVCMRTG